MQKLQDDWNKDLAKIPDPEKPFPKPKANIWRYIAEDKEESEGEEQAEQKEAVAIATSACAAASSSFGTPEKRLADDHPRLWFQEFKVIHMN